MNSGPTVHSEAQVLAVSVQMPLQQSAPIPHASPSPAHGGWQTPPWQIPLQQSAPALHAPSFTVQGATHTPLLQRPLQQSPPSVQALPFAAQGIVQVPDSQCPLQHAPSLPHADHVLKEKGITVVPDILANAGGVTVSYFEWTQNLQQFYWSEQEVQTKLEAVMERAYREVSEMARKYKVPMRMAAFMTAIQRVYEAVLLRGV
jgi:hypothetical protein